MSRPPYEVARYTVTVTVDRPIRREEWDPAYSEMECLAEYTEPKTLRELEREIYRALKPVDGDTDCEVIEARIVSEEHA